VALYQIPLSRPPLAGAFSQRTDLGGTDYVLDLDWVSRWGEGLLEVPGAWRLSVSTLSGRVLAVGRALVPGSLLLQQLSDDERPAGDLSVVSPGGAVPGLDDLGRTAHLVYLDGEDLDAVREALYGPFWGRLADRSVV
jgi:hypothetical protein